MNIIPVLCLAVLLVTAHSSFGQGMVITSGATCKASGDASIILKDADLVNDGAFLAYGGSTVSFKGTFLQSIGGASSSDFDNLLLDNNGGLELNNTESVNGTLTFINGKITLGNNDLIMGPSASISGSSSSNYMVTNGGGSLRQWVNNNATDVAYPVGLENDFLPVTLQLAVGSMADELSARVINGLYTAYDGSGVPTGSLITDHGVSRTWILEEATSGGSNATIKLQWNAASESTGFNLGSCDIGHYTGGAWDFSSASAAAGSDPYTQTLSGITSFSPFGVFSQSIRCSVSPAEYCAGAPASVDYSPFGGLWTSGNVFTAQLSDASGSFDSPVPIGTLESQTAGSINATIPSGATDGTGYRVRVSGSLPSITGYKNSEDITINQLRGINGNITYYNTDNTPLATGVNVQLYQDGEPLGSDTVTDGTYSFGGLCPGQYELRVSSTRPTDGSVNTTDAGQVNFWGAHPYAIEKVRFYAGDVTGGSFFINSTDALLIKSHFVYGTAFEKGEPWTFWVAGQTISSNSNPPNSYPQVTLAAGSDLSANIYGLCAGDFNRSFNGGAKSGPELKVANEGSIRVGSNTEIEVPVYLISGSGIGAISLCLNFQTELAEITGVTAKYSDENVDWAVHGNELRIGWFSQNPSFLADQDELLSIRIKTSQEFTTGKQLVFTLSADPMSEIADENYIAVSNAALNIKTVGSPSMGIEDPSETDFSFAAYPNPFTDNVRLAYTLPQAGNVMIEISNILGGKSILMEKTYQPSGNHSVDFVLSPLASGIYIVTMKVNNNSNTQFNTIRVIKENHHQ